MITDSAGAEIEMFSADELEVQKTAALEEYKVSNPDRTSELESLQVELEEREKELAKLKGKDLNFENLRKQKEAAEDRIEKVKREIESKLEATKKEVLEGVNKEHYNEELARLAGDDAELKDKIEFQYNRLTDLASNKMEVSKKLRDAWTLATKVDAGALNTAVISSGGVSRLNVRPSQKFSVEEMEVGRKFGLAKEDFEKYATN
jgi:alanyl-tRNA synthetase